MLQRCLGRSPLPSATSLLNAPLKRCIITADHGRRKIACFLPSAQYSTQASGSSSSTTNGNDGLRTFSWGSGEGWKLGHGDVNSVRSPKAIEELNGCKVLALACGAWHTLALLDSATGVKVFGWGSNFFGQCGDVSDPQLLTSDSTSVPSDPNVNVLGSSFGFLLDDDEEDQVSLPSCVKQFVGGGPVAKDGSQQGSGNHNEVMAIAAGNFHSAALTRGGEIYTWGGGILGHNHEIYDSNPLPIRFFHDVGRHITAISANSDITAVLATSSIQTDQSPCPEVYVWGYLRDDKGNLKKALAPALVKHALTLRDVKEVVCGSGYLRTADYYTPGGASFAIRGTPNEKGNESPREVVLVFGAPPSQASELATRPKGILARLLPSRWGRKGKKAIKEGENTEEVAPSDFQLRPPDYPFRYETKEAEVQNLKEGKEGQNEDVDLTGVYSYPPIKVVKCGDHGAVKQVAIGSDFGLILYETGTIDSFPISSPPSAPTKTPDATSDLISIPTFTPENDKPLSLSVGETQVMVLTKQGRVFTWSLRDNGSGDSGLEPSHSNEGQKESVGTAAEVSLGQVASGSKFGGLLGLMTRKPPILSRAKPAINPANQNALSTSTLDKKSKIPKLETFIANRDYTGAITLLEFLKATGKTETDTLLWLGYAAFHLGDYRKAMETYQTMLQDKNCDPIIHLYLACCYFFLGMYKEADEEAQRGPTCKLQNRLLFHLSHKFNDEKRLMGYHQNLQDVIEDQLSLASIHYLRSHYQEAIDIYKRILLENRDFIAINVYVAMCYYKLDYYDVSQEVLSVYLQHYPDSIIGVCLKACNLFRLYNGKAAEAELKSLTEKISTHLDFAEDLIKHNLVVFRNGETALQVLPPLLDVIPESRLNLVIYHLKNDDIVAAFNLMKDVEPSTPQEYILKGIVNAALGQEQESREHLKIAQQYFQLVGGSASECDTIPGRQCMASCFFLLKQFEDVLIYLNSIKGYFYNDDTFNYNYAQAKVATGAYEEAEEVFSMIQNERFKNEYAFLSHLARCYIMNKKPRLAWELYLKMETSSESFSLLQLIANDAYKMKQYYYSAKAFDVLERLDPNPEYWEGKRGACIGVFQQVIAGQEPKDSLRDVVTMLRNTSNPQVEYIIRIIKKVY
ncbi:Intraflagellar transport protein 56 [Quaeritorhiza haematococci]|nr:Intraflagellar transport protein 56 [Quaeritorhiza haematococci]